MGPSLSAARANVKVTAKGTVSNFGMGSEIVFDPDSESTVSSEALGLKADAEVTWAAFSAKQPTLDETVTSFQVPLSLPIPISAGPIPLALTIKANVRIVPALSVDKASSGGSFAISYTSDQGFDIKGQQPSALAKLYEKNVQLGTTDTVTAGFGPAGFGVRGRVPADGARYPRFERALRFHDHQQLRDWLVDARDDAHQRHPAVPEGITDPVGNRGLQVQVLGLPLGVSDQNTLWQHAWEKYKDDVPCTLTGS